VSGLKLFRTTKSGVTTLGNFTFLDQEMLDTAELVAAELLANAVRHAGDGPISDGACLSDECLLIDVTDASRSCRVLAQRCVRRCGPIPAWRCWTRPRNRIGQRARPTGPVPGRGFRCGAARSTRVP